jgi:molecular chaperone DnaK
MIIGIDLGSTYTLGAYINPQGEPVLIPDYQSKMTSTPSVAILGKGNAMIGGHALTKYEQNPERLRLLSYFKRQMGSADVQALDELNQEWYAEGLSALVLKKIKYDAERAIGQIHGAVITVPAHFNANQRKAVQTSASLAGFEFVELLDEPVAAAIHYGYAHNDTHRIFFVYDFGGGTFDATVLSYDTEHGIDVLSQDGHHALGGRELDEIIQTKLIQLMESDQPNTELNAYSMTQLRRVAEEIKVEFSDPGKFFLRKQVLVGTWAKECYFKKTEFEEEALQKVRTTFEISKRCLQDAQIPIDAVDAFLMVGGSSLVPVVKEKFVQELGLDPTKVQYHQPMHAIVYGAAIKAAQIFGASNLQALPNTFRGTTGYHAGFRTINPKTGETLIDVLIKKNSPLTSSGFKQYYTTRANQDHILLELVQFFESPIDAVSLGRVIIGPIANPMLNYEIRVSLEYTRNGRLQIKATDPQTSREIKFAFENADTDAAFYMHQKAIIDKTIINTIGESER